MRQKGFIPILILLFITVLTIGGIICLKFKRISSSLPQIPKVQNINQGETTKNEYKETPYPNMVIFDGKFKQILKDVFSGKIKYESMEGGVSHYDYSPQGDYGVTTYLYDSANPSITRHVGFQEGEDVIYNLKAEIETFNKLKTTKSNVKFFSYFTGEGYREVDAYKKQIGNRFFAVYDTCSPYAGSSSTNYFTYDSDNKQLVYINIWFEGCNKRSDEENKYLMRVEKEILLMD